MNASILVRPLLTEKTASLSEGRHYAFVVAKAANKIQIRQAIQARYPAVEITEVRTMVVRGKTRRQMTKKGVREGRRPGYKKAIVTLAPSSAPIEFYESV